ncbi:MAG: hypothetical protein NC078_01195 [Ruminococcus sp.]|nr:hypothetical protein [Ruminococcus sp.]
MIKTAADFDDLRRELEDYYGTAAAVFHPAAMPDVFRAEEADEDELLAMAEEAGIYLEEFEDR